MDMSKLEKLRKLYDEIELDSTDERQLLAKVKNGTASKQEIDDLLDMVNNHSQGGQKLQSIKNFEETLISQMNNSLDSLEEMVDEYLDVAHIENETEKNNMLADMKSRYNGHISDADETLEALKRAYFQVGDYSKFEERLYKAKEELSHFE